MKSLLDAGIAGDPLPDEAAHRHDEHQHQDGGDRQQHLQVAVAARSGGEGLPDRPRC